MKKFLRPFLRLIGFFACLTLLLLYADTHFIQTDIVAAVTIREMQQRSDIELAFVGSSVARDHFNPELITRQTGKITASVAVPCASLPADLAMMEELFRTNSPEWVVLVMEPYGIVSVKEDFEAEYKLMPMLTSPATMLRYYLRLCALDGEYIDRLFLFRTLSVSSWSDFLKTVGMRHAPFETFERLKDTLGPDIEYMGSGFLRYTTQESAETLIRQQMGRKEDSAWVHELQEPSRRMLQEAQALCEENGAQLLLLLYPMHTSHFLAKPDFLPYNESLMRFCEENGIPCFNFSFARPEFMPSLDSYYFDLDHMNSTGADILSGAFANFFNSYAAGEDVSGLFYATQEEYLASIDFITNCWVYPGEETNTFSADCNRAPQVAPEYRFELRAPDGTQTLLRDYSPETDIEVALPEGYDLRVYARPQGDEDAEPVYYDYPTDYDAYFGKE